MTARAVDYVSWNDVARVSRITHRFLDSVPSIQNILFLHLCIMSMSVSEEGISVLEKCTFATSWQVILAKT
jgi:hypothetical protein